MPIDRMLIHGFSHLFFESTAEKGFQANDVSLSLF
jgi:hypothetical protein